MSSLDSSTNAVASVVATEWVRVYQCGARQPASGLLALGRRVSMLMSTITVLGALGLTGVEKESMNDLYNGLISLTGGASGGLMILLIFTSSAKSDEPKADQRWHTPSIDGCAALVGVAMSLAVSLLAALCSFEILDDYCSLSYYWILPLSNASFAMGVMLCVMVRRIGATHGWSRCRMPTSTSRPSPATPASTNATSDGVELLRSSICTSPPNSQSVSHCSSSNNSSTARIQG